MPTKFQASIELDATSAIAQANKFSREVGKSTKELKNFKREMDAVAQGGATNAFVKYEQAANRLDSNLRKVVASVHASNKPFSKLTQEQQSAVTIVSKLNKKYDESARSLSELKRIRNELNIIVASGLKTQSQANRLFAEQEKRIRQGTKAFREEQAVKMQARNLRKKEISQLKTLKAKYSEEYQKKIQLRRINRELNKLEKIGFIDRAKKLHLMDAEVAKLDAINARTLINQNSFANLARQVSIFSRVLLGLTIGAGVIRSFVHLEKIAEQIDLMRSKLSFLTGDIDAFDKLYDVSQKVGVGLEDAGRILTRFAVVTNKAFSTEQMTDWVATVTKSARATGTSTQEMTGALIQITQAMSAGRLMGDEYRSVTENLPLLTVALRELFKDSNKSLKELSSEGKVTTEKMVEAFEKLKVIIKDIPGTTGTIEAKINAMGAAWDKFINTVVASKASGAIAEFFTMELNAAIFLIEDLGEKIDRLQITNVEKNIEFLQKTLSAQEKTVINSKQASVIAGQHHVFLSGIANKTETINGIVFSTLSNTADLNKELKKQLEIKNRMLGIDQASLATDENRRKIAATKKEELKKEAAEASATLLRGFVSGGEREKIIEDFKQDVRTITGELKKGTDEAKRGGFTPDQAKQAFEAITRTKNNALLKLAEKEMSEQLRIRGFTVSVDVQKLKDQLDYQGKFEQSKKAHYDRLKAIDAARERGRLLEVSGKSLLGAKGVLTDPEANKMRIQSENILLAEQAKEYDKLINKITSLGNTAQEIITSADKNPLAMFESKKIKRLNDFEVGVRKASDALSKLSGPAHIEGAKQYSDTVNKLALAMQVLNEQDKEAIVSGLRQEFSARTEAVKQYEDSLVKLDAAVKLLNLTDREREIALRKINKTYRDSINIQNALIDQTPLLTQVMQGMTSGFENFSDSQKTVFEQIADLTESSTNRMADAILDFTKGGKDAFKNLALSIIDDLNKILIKTLIIKPIIDSLTGGGSGFGGFDLGFDLGGIGDFFGLGSGALSGSAGFGSSVADVLSGAEFLAFAGGGRPPVGQPSIVGEEGPELFVPDSSGTIVPNGSIGGNTVQINYKIDARGADEGVEMRIAAAMRETEDRTVNRVQYEMGLGGSMSKASGRRRG